MFIELYTVVSLLLTHFIGDFILQTDKMAVNKSTSFKWLTIHALTYMIPLSLFYIIMFSHVGILTLITVIIANFSLHWITDMVTSRVASYYFKNDKRGMFFKTIGFDQLIHGVTLVTLHVLIL